MELNQVFCSIAPQTPVLGALKREVRIKKLSRGEKVELIKGWYTDIVQQGEPRIWQKTKIAMPVDLIVGTKNGDDRIDGHSTRSRNS